MVTLNDRAIDFLVALGRFYPNGSWNPQSIFGIVVAEEQNVFARIFEAGHRQPYSLSSYHLRWAVDLQLWRQYIEPVSGHPFRHINDMPAMARAPGGRYCQRFEFYCAQRHAMEAQRAGGPANIARNPAVAGHVNMAPPGVVAGGQANIARNPAAAGHVNMAPPGVIAGGQANIAHNPAVAELTNAAPPGVTTRRPINIYHNQAVVGQFQVGPADAVAAGGQANNADSPAAAGTSVYVIVAGEGSVRPVRSQANNAGSPAAAANVPPAPPPAVAAGEGGPRVAGAAEPLNPAQADNNLRLPPRAGPAGLGGGGDAPAVSGSSAGLRGAAVAGEYPRLVGLGRRRKR